MSGTARGNERIPRRPLPDFEETESGIIEGISESGFLKVALDDANQYGPHAMIALLGIVAAATAAILMIAMFAF
ncbi:MAG: hypothetical protein QGI73_01975 [Candidatus Thalassarchaeaceae archaeon]|jgi:hypothetical protein|nr:hypothetical protein [Euryarchaeota archaeon]MDP6870985.1 hypothetical protein [Candidatus Thalassarchaeaceae archaeon]|tara:strand:+ start:2807 stop:3028 length:222 start_codon:yes stop_codon:yes gene_type:complete